MQASNGCTYHDLSPLLQVFSQWLNCLSAGTSCSSLNNRHFQCYTSCKDWSRVRAPVLQHAFSNDGKSWNVEMLICNQLLVYFRFSNLFAFVSNHYSIINIKIKVISLNFINREFEFNWKTFNSYECMFSSFSSHKRRFIMTVHQLLTSIIS